MNDETDLKLVNLLQIEPRMPWARVGEILGLSGPTVANRWHRLQEAGLAWITAHPNMGRHFSALVEIDCRTEKLPSAIAQLCAHPQIVTVDEATGRRDLLAMVICPGMNAMTALIIDWIGGLDGVYGTRSSLITEVISGSDGWRLNALSQRQLIEAGRHVPVEKPPSSFGELDKALYEALARDGRAGIATLSRELDVPVSTIHRHMRRLLTTRQVITRCDVSPLLGGWELECTWLTTVAVSHKSKVAGLLKGHPALRWAMWTTGNNNMIMNSRINDLSALSSIESVTAMTMPGLAPETIIHLRAHKSMGWMLDNDGNTTGELVVPDFGPVTAAS